jgi:hypothetical protein
MKKSRTASKKPRAKVPAPTQQQLDDYAGKNGTWAPPIKSIDPSKPFTIAVKVISARWLFGRLEFRIRPQLDTLTGMGGTGETWAQGVEFP